MLTQSDWESKKKKEDTLLSNIGMCPRTKGRWEDTGQTEEGVQSPEQKDV